MIELNRVTTNLRYNPMKRWAAEKILLSYDENESSMLQDAIEKQIDNSSECQEEHQKYLQYRHNMESLNKVSLPEENFDDYWEELKGKLDSSSPNAPLPSYTLPAYDRYQNLNRVIAIAAVLLIAVGVVFNFDKSSISTPANITMGHYPSKSHVGKIFTNLEFLNRDLVPKVWRIDLTAPADNVRNSFKPQEYKLDQVYPCVLEDASF